MGCAATIVRRSAPVVASLLLSACGALIGIKPLEVSDEDAGVVIPLPDAEASVPVVDASSEDGATEIAPPRRPPEGAYLYTVTGDDAISGGFTFASTYKTPATVTVAHIGADCFTLKISPRDNYDETMSLCIKGNEVVQATAVRNQQFAFNIAARTTSTCKPGDVYLSSAPSPNQTWNHECSGMNSDDRTGGSTFVTAGTYQYRGNGATTTDAGDVPVMHFHDDRMVTGKQSGKNVADWYFGVEDGVLVRLSRNVELDYPLNPGNIHYHETLLMTLMTRPALPGDAGTD